MNINDIKWLLPITTLNSTQKIILADIFIYEEDQFTGKDCYLRLGIDKHTWNKQMRALVKRKIVNRVDRWSYKLNLNDLF